MRIQYAAVVLLLLGGWQAIAQTGDTQQIADPNFTPTVRGEAAMFSAQVIRFTDPQGHRTESKMGMNVPGNDNQQFLVNILRWLTHHNK